METKACYFLEIVCQYEINRGTYISSHVLLNLLNNLGK